MSRRACVVGLAVVCVALASAALAGEAAAPLLPVLSSNGGSVSLEDFKGQMTAVVFFNDAAS